MNLAATRNRSALRKAVSSSDLMTTWQLSRQHLKSSSYGIDRVSGKQFDAERFWRIPSIWERRFSKPFTASPLIALSKPKNSGGHRIICIPTIEDRLIQLSIISDIKESIKQKGLLNSISYGLIANANRTVQCARDRATLLRKGGRWVYKTDIQKFFDNIPRDRLISEMRRIVNKRSLHDVLTAFVRVEIGDGFTSDWEKIVAGAGIHRGVGVRQGMPLSPYFAGMILLRLDKELERRRLPVIRYVDDIVGFFDSEKECIRFDSYLRERLGEISLELGLINAPGSKTEIFGPEQAIEFLGMEMSFNKDQVCTLSVSRNTLDRIESRFAELAQIDVLLSKNLTLPDLGSRLIAMERGYIAAYQGASNMSELKAMLSRLKGPLISSILEEIFGVEMHKIGAKERRFLGIV